MPRTNYVKKARREYRCDRCGKTIEVGQPYKHMSPRLPGSYGSRKLIRCDACPGWQSWEYSNSLASRIAKIQYDGGEAIIIFADENSITDVPAEIAQEIRDLAEEKREAAQNMEDGFGHSTYQSEELNETADSLDGWADEVEQALESLEDKPELATYEADGEDDPEDRYASDLEDWMDSARSAIESALDNCPL